MVTSSPRTTASRFAARGTHARGLGRLAAATALALALTSVVAGLTPLASAEPTEQAPLTLVLGMPSTVSVGNVTFVYARADDGRLVRFTKRGSGDWKMLDVSDRFPGLLIAGDPFAVYDGVEHRIFARTPSDALIMVAFRPPSGWLLTNVSNRVGKLVLGDPTATTNEKGTHIFVRGQAGSLLRFQERASGWTVETLNSDAGEPSISNRPYAVATGSGGQAKLHVAARAFDGSLVLFTGQPNDWQMENVSSQVGDQRIALSPKFGTVASTMTIYAQGVGGHLVLFRRTLPAKPWIFVDVSSQVGDRQIAGDPSPTADGPDRYVYARANDDRLLIFVSRPPDPWGLYDVSEEVVGPLRLVGGNPHVVTQGSNTYVYIRGESGRLLQFRAEPPEPWRLTDISRQASEQPLE